MNGHTLPGKLASCSRTAPPTRSLDLLLSLVCFLSNFSYCMYLYGICFMHTALPLSLSVTELLWPCPLKNIEIWPRSQASCRDSNPVLSDAALLFLCRCLNTLHYSPVRDHDISVGWGWFFFLAPQREWVIQNVLPNVILYCFSKTCTHFDSCWSEWSSLWAWIPSLKTQFLLRGKCYWVANKRNLHWLCYI